MENNSDNLFMLIKSLTKAEKRYFKLNADRQEGQKDYIDLFEVVDKQDEYNEEKILGILKNKGFVTRYSAVKNYLFNSIIDNLNEFSAYDTIEFKLQKLIRKIKFLHEKGLIDICLKYIEKANKIGYDNENYDELIILLSIQHQISMRNSIHLYKRRNEIREELNQAIEKSYNYSHYLKLELTLNDLLYTQNISSDSIELTTFLENPLIKYKEKAITNKATAVYLKIHAKICDYKGLKEDAVYYAHEILKNIEASSVPASVNPLIYARAINTYLQACIEIKRFEHFEHYLSVLKGFLDLRISSEHINAIKGFYYLNLIHRYIAYGKFSNVIEILSAHKKELIANNLIPLKFKIFIQYFECVALIGMAEYKASLKLLQTTLRGNQNVISPLKRVSCILSMIILYDLNYIDLLLNELDSTKKFARGLPNNQGEKVIIKYLTLLLKCFDKKERIECFEKFKNEIFNLDNNAKEASIAYFDLISWIEGKMQGKSFAMIVQEKALNYPSTC